MELKSLEKRLEEKALKRLKNDVSTAIENFKRVFDVSGVQVDCGREEVRVDLYFLFQDIADALNKNKRKHYINQETEEFMNSIEDAKEAIAELGNTVQQ